MDKAEKKVKKEHKHRHHHHRKEDRKQSSSLSSSSSSNIIVSSSSDHLRGNHLNHPGGESAAGNSNTSLMDELRQRRLQREKQERKRANVLLANVDIFGAGPQRRSCEVDAAGDDSYQYHQQFHPHLLKDKKNFAFTKR